MRILAIETSAAACSAAVWSEGAQYERFEPMARGQAERLMPLIGEIMAEANVGYADLDLVAVATGPGTFTGMRIGLAAARGIALAAGLPCVGVTSFAAVLEAAGGAAGATWARGSSVLVVLDSRRSEVFAQLFRSVDDGAEAVVATPEALARRFGGTVGLIAGTAAATVASAFAAEGHRVAVAEVAPSAAAVAAIAARSWSSEWRPEGLPDPVYLRAPDTGGVRP